MTQLAWLSFADGTLPEGQQFLGACIVDVPDGTDEASLAFWAIKAAWAHGCNPGGEVLVYTIEGDKAGALPRYRLFLPEEARQIAETGELP